jgi:hypothetical protein
MWLGLLPSGFFDFMEINPQCRRRSGGGSGVSGVSGVVGSLALDAAQLVSNLRTALLGPLQEEEGEGRGASGAPPPQYTGETVSTKEAALPMRSHQAKAAAAAIRSKEREVAVARIVKSRIWTRLSHFVIAIMQLGVGYNAVFWSLREMKGEDFSWSVTYRYCCCSCFRFCFCFCIRLLALLTFFYTPHRASSSCPSCSSTSLQVAPWS